MKRSVSARKKITAAEVTPVIVTRGDVDLEPITRSLLRDDYGIFSHVVIYDNSFYDDLSVYGRYAAIEQTDAPVIFVQDDDVIIPRESLERFVAEYEPGKIVANMGREYRERYTDSCLVGFGAIFDRDLPLRAFKRFWDGGGTHTDAYFRRTCDVVFTSLTDRKIIDVPFEMLPHAFADNRMYRQPGHTDERTAMLRLCRQVRKRAR